MTEKHIDCSDLRPLATNEVDELYKFVTKCTKCLTWCEYTSIICRVIVYPAMVKDFYGACRTDVEHVSHILINLYEIIVNSKKQILTIKTIDRLIEIFGLITSASDDVGSSKAIELIRRTGYKLLSYIRPQHFLIWANRHMLNHSSYAKSISDQSTTKKRSKIFLRRFGGTGAGFRKAVTEWYRMHTNSVEAIRELMPYINDSSKTITHKDLLCLVHPKPTTRTKCKCKTKNVCECNRPDPKNIDDVYDLPVQILLGYVRYGSEQANIIFSEGLDRLTSKEIEYETEINPIVKNALQVLIIVLADNVIQMYEKQNDIFDNLNIDKEMVYKLSGINYNLNKSNQNELSVSKTLLKLFCNRHTLIDYYYNV